MEFLWCFRADCRKELGNIDAFNIKLLLNFEKEHGTDTNKLRKSFYGESVELCEIILENNSEEKIIIFPWHYTSESYLVFKNVFTSASVENDCEG